MSKTDVFYFEGLDDVLFAMMTTKETVSTPPEYGEIVRLPIATKLKVKGNGSELEKWASSKMFRRVSRETKHEIGLDHVGIPIEVMDELKGLIASSGVTFGKNTVQELPYFAFGFIGNVEGGGKKVVWYPKTQISNVVDEEYATAEEETKIDDVTANLVATGLNNNGVMYSSFDSNRDSAVDVSVDKFIAQPVYDEEQWKNIVKGTDPAIPVTSVALTPATATVKVNETTQLSAKITPDNATNKGVGYASSDETIATVDSSGKVTGKKVGTATITVTTNDSNKTANSTVTVEAAG